MEPYLGEIRIFGGSFAPVGWLACNGTLQSIAEFEALYTLLGTTYGGDGQNTFALPDLRGRVQVNQGVSAGSGTNYLIGQIGGTESVTLTNTNLPAHQHTFSVANTPATQVAAANSFLANPVDTVATNPKNILFYLPDSAQETVQPLLADSMTPAGSSQPHENRQPFLTINYIICTSGIYPSQQ